MGAVFLARDSKLDREVAPEVVVSGGEAAQALFVREARLTTSTRTSSRRTTSSRTHAADAATASGPEWIPERCMGLVGLPPCRRDPRKSSAGLCRSPSLGDGGDDANGTRPPNFTLAHFPIRGVVGKGGLP